MKDLLYKYGFTPVSFFQLILITVNAQLIYAFGISEIVFQVDFLPH